MTEIDLTDSRAEDAQPQGFVPSHLATPMLRSSERTAWDYTARTLGEMRLRSAIAEGVEDATTRSALLEENEREATRLQRMARAFAVGVLPALLVVVAALVAGPTPGRAEAAEAPQPDPVAAVSVVARTVPVVLGAVPVTVYVRATVYTPVAPGWWCASVWSAARGRVAGTCSISASFPIPVTIDPRTFPVGRTFAQVVDDATDVAVSNVTFDVRRPSRFGVGTFLDLGRGDLGVRVPVTLYSPTAGRWVPQVQSPVQIQELVGRTWRVRATLVTSPPGLAVGVVHLGGGRHVIRAVRPAGATVWGTTGRTRIVTITTEPLDVD